MKTKRLTNTTGLKFAFIPPTNDKGSRIRITQMNCNKSVYVSGNRNLEPIDFICSVLDKIELINTYSLLVDNTQSNYYIFNIDFNGNSFENILNEFKK